MNVFGPPLAEYGPRKSDIIVFALLAVGAFWLAWLALQQTGDDKAAGRYEAAICLAVGIPLAILALWNSRRRVVLYKEGLSYSSLFGEKQVHWDNVNRLYYKATKMSVNFIPIGTAYWIRITDNHGQRVRFGSGLVKMASLTAKVLELAQGPLLEKIATEFDAGADIEFGPIRVNRQSGVAIKKLWGRTKQIPWCEVHSYRIEEGRIYIWRKGEKRAAGIPISEVPNVFALLARLDIIFKPTEASER